uniref:Putative ATPase domain containing protein n=1 Tax=viral metagenome TaxID=1070528 RepID=A0A6M3L2V7_9ZZZZ
MPEEGLWIENPTTGEPDYVYYNELEQSALTQLIKTVGGFCWLANEFVQISLPSVPFYIKDWLPKHGKAMIYAPAKSGKSYLCLQIARCIGVGESVLGIPTSKGSVLYCQLELGAEVLQGRIKSTGKSYDNVYVGTIFSMKLDTLTGQTKLKEAMVAIKPDVLIIDPMYKVLAGDENETKDMRTLTDFLDSLIEAYGCSILIIHHPGKDIKKGARGAVVLEDWVDSCIEMKKISKPDDALKIRLTPKLLRHAELPPSPVEAVMKGYEFTTTGGAAPTVLEQVEEIMKHSALPIAPKLLFGLGIGSNASVYGALDRLVALGQATKIGRGSYQWNKGKE